MKNHQARPQLSIVIPVLNDAQLLERLLRRLSSLAATEDVEVLVVDGGSQDRSGEIARALGARVLTTSTGRGVQLNAGCQAARGVELKSPVRLLQRRGLFCWMSLSLALIQFRWWRSSASFAISRRGELVFW